MKQAFTFIIIALLLTDCTSYRYYYTSSTTVDLYEFPSLADNPLLKVKPGDTISTSNVISAELGGKIPIEYKGYYFYSNPVRVRFLYKTKINPKTDITLPAVTYAARMSQKAKDEKAKIDEEYSRKYWAEQDKIEWFGRIDKDTPLQKDSDVTSDTIVMVPANSIVKIKRHSYSRWKTIINGRTGYITAFRISHYSKTQSPFMPTRYTGRTFEPDGQDYSSGWTNTPTTGAAIHTGPKGGRYYINNHGNKTYIKR